MLTYDTRVRGNRGEFLTLPFRVTHRGPATLVLTLERNECGTVESFLTWVRRTTDPTVLFWRFLVPAGNLCHERGAGPGRV